MPKGDGPPQPPGRMSRPFPDLPCSYCDMEPCRATPKTLNARDVARFERAHGKIDPAQRVSFVRHPAHGEAATDGIRNELDSVGEKLHLILVKKSQTLDLLRELRRRYLEDCKAWGVQPHAGMRAVW